MAEVVLGKGVEIVLPEDIYTGSQTHLSPDIFFTVNDFRASIEIDLASRAFLNTPSIALRSGGHIMDGIFIASGDSFTQLRSRFSILDVAPTILALYGCDIPEEMDGSVLERCLSPQMREVASKVKKVKIAPSVSDEMRQGGDLEEMRKMLKSLGYL